MRSARNLAVLAVASTLAGALLPAGTASAQRAGNDSMQLAGRTAQCKGVRIVSDNRLPSEGAAGPGVLMLNPSLLSRLPGTVRLFVFSHECGHHHVGGSELQADCWAVEQGVRQGWLDAKGLDQVCRSFDDAPATATHPSGRKRCRNLDKCFTTAVATRQAGNARAVAPTPPAPHLTAANPAPRLVSGPTLLTTGTQRYLWDAAPCKDAADRSAKRDNCP